MTEVAEMAKNPENPASPASPASPAITELSDGAHGHSRDRDSARRVLLAGGGTGGHVFPGLALAAELEQRGWEVSWAGAASGLEGKLVAARGMEFHPLAARPLRGKSATDQAAALGTLMRSTWQARRLISRLAPSAVVGTGGYASAPALLGAYLAGRPILVLEPNAHAGLANRLLSWFASAAAVAYEGTERELECAGWATGVPVRAEFHSVPEELPEGSTRLFVLGGSQGSRHMNQAVPQAVAALLAEEPGLCVLHQAGERHVEETRAAYAGAGLSGPRFEVVPFVDEVAAAMAASHLIVARAGAMTLAEICAAGRPALLVPLALAGGHQAANADRLVEAGAAIAVPDAAASGERLAEALRPLLSDRRRLRAMGRAARVLARPRAAAEIADLLEWLAGGPS